MRMQYNFTRKRIYTQKGIVQKKKFEKIWKYRNSPRDVTPKWRKVQILPSELSWWQPKSNVLCNPHFVLPLIKYKDALHSIVQGRAFQPVARGPHRLARRFFAAREVKYFHIFAELMKPE